MEKQLLEMNEALLVSSLKQHELAEQAQRAAAALRDSEVSYRRLFQSSKDGILILDADTGRILDVNAFMCGLIGRDTPEIVGKELWEIGMFTSIAENKKAFRELQANGYVRHDHLPIQKPNGKVTQVEFVSTVYQEAQRRVAQCN